MKVKWPLLSVWTVHYWFWLVRVPEKQDALFLELRS